MNGSIVPSNAELEIAFRVSPAMKDAIKRKADDLQLSRSAYLLALAIADTGIEPDSSFSKNEIKIAEQLRHTKQNADQY